MDDHIHVKHEVMAVPHNCNSLKLNDLRFTELVEMIKVIKKNSNNDRFHVLMTVLSQKKRKYYTDRSSVLAQVLGY